MSVKKWDKAKEKDKEGKYARIGMETMCAHWFNIEKRNSACVKAIVDDYLENVNMDFFMWIRCGSPKRSPIILKRNYLEGVNNMKKNNMFFFSINYDNCIRSNCIYNH